MIDCRRDYAEDLEEYLIVIQELLNNLPFLMAFEFLNRWVFALNNLFINASKRG
jgi:hypothetical protein